MKVILAPRSPEIIPRMEASINDAGACGRKVQSFVLSRDEYTQYCREAMTNPANSQVYCGVRIDKDF